MKILLPKTYVDIHKDTPVFFLAGPVRGGDDWQLQCIKLIEEMMREKDFYIAIPYFVQILSDDHLCLLNRVHGEENKFDRQLNWERYYLDIASKQGCIIFWLPEQSKINPRPDGVYARDTMGELGEWRGVMMNNSNCKVVVGGEDEFDGFDIISRNFKLALGNDFEIHKTLEDTVKGAVLKLD